MGTCHRSTRAPRRQPCAAAPATMPVDGLRARHGHPRTRRTPSLLPKMPSPFFRTCDAPGVTWTDGGEPAGPEQPRGHGHSGTDTQPPCCRPPRPCPAGPSGTGTCLAATLRGPHEPDGRRLDSPSVPLCRPRRGDTCRTAAIGRRRHVVPRIQIGECIFTKKSIVHLVHAGFALHSPRGLEKHVG